VTPSSDQIAGDQTEIVRSIVAESYVDMLRACGLSAFVVDSRVPAVTNDHVVGLIPFTGAVRGSLGITASCALYRITYPLGEGGPVATSPGDILDWAGEMANQTLGRVKRRFCERGIDFEISTPTAVYERDVEGQASRGDVISVLVRVGAELSSIEFEIIASADGGLLRDGATPIACLAEGELVMF
jgi:CheY-specific phosphatase CheX